MQPVPENNIDSLFTTSESDSLGRKKLLINDFEKKILAYLNTEQALNIENLNKLSKTLNEISLGTGLEKDKNLKDRLQALKDKVRRAKKTVSFFKEMSRKHTKAIALDVFKKIPNRHDHDEKKLTNLFYYHLLKRQIGDDDLFETFISKQGNAQALQDGTAYLTPEAIQDLACQKNMKTIRPLLERYDPDIVEEAIRQRQPNNPNFYNRILEGKILLFGDLNLLQSHCENKQLQRTTLLQARQETFDREHPSLRGSTLAIGEKSYTLLHYLVLTEPSYRKDILNDTLNPATKTQLTEHLKLRLQQQQQNQEKAEKTLLTAFRVALEPNKLLEPLAKHLVARAWQKHPDAFSQARDVGALEEALQQNVILTMTGYLQHVTNNLSNIQNPPHQGQGTPLTATIQSASDLLDKAAAIDASWPNKLLTGDLSFKERNTLIKKLNQLKSPHG